MSEKMKKFFNEDTDLEKYLVESVIISRIDRDNIISYIKHAKFGSFKINRYDISVYVRNGNRTVVFEYDDNFDELTKELIDMCDDMKMKFNTGTVGKIIQRK